MLLQGQARDETCQGLGPLTITISLPPVRVIFADNMEDIPPLEGDAKLVTRNIEIIVRSVGEVGSEVILE